MRDLITAYRLPFLAVLLILALAGCGGDKEGSERASLVAFVSTRDGNQEIYVMRRDGSGQTRLTNRDQSDQRPVISPNGDRILFVSWEGNTPAILSMKPDGTDLTSLSDGSTFDYSPVWSPDGSQIAFIRSEPPRLDLTTVHLMSADGSQVTDLGIAAEYVHDWSPDGKSLLFQRGLSLFVLSVEGGDVTQLEVAGPPDLAVGAGMGLAAWSPDGRQISFVAVPAPGSGQRVVTRADSVLAVADFDGRELRNVRTLDSGEADWESIAWSPDGTQIIYTGVKENNTDLYAITVEDGRVTRLTTESAFDGSADWTNVPQLPPLVDTDTPSTVETVAPESGPEDDGLIAFLSDRDGSDDVYVVRPDGSGLRRVTFTAADEEDPDISWDGSKIAYVSREVEFGPPEIHVVNVDGSGHRALTNVDESWDHSPRWSPDGTRLAFVSTTISSMAQHGIFTMNQDGTDRTLIVAGGVSAPAWSPDGSRILYVKGSGLYSANSDGSGNERLILRELPFLLARPSWSPDGRQIAFEGLDWQISLVNVDGSGLIQLPAYGEKPDWSPDGSRVVFTTSAFHDASLPPESQVFIVNTDGSNLLQLSEGPGSSSSASWSGGLYTPTLEPTEITGRQATPSAEPAKCERGTPGSIAFSTTRDGNHEIYVMNGDGANQVDLSRNPALDYSPAWSPDGCRMAFVSTRDGNAEIYVMDANGANLVRLTYDQAVDGSPAWSPDGTRIAFTSRREGNDDVYLMNADGSNPVNLTNSPGWDDYASWSPDGTRIAFDSDRSGNFEIYTMNADGSDLINITNDAGFDRAPSWSPDGSHIAFTTRISERPVISVMNADGSGRTTLTDAPNSSPVWSPDGNRIAFVSSRDGNFEIYVMNADGSDQTRLTDTPGTEQSPSWLPDLN